MSEEHFDDVDIVFEVKGRDDTWKVLYPDEGGTLTPFIWYDKEGEVKTVIYAGGDVGKYTETNETFPTAKAACDYAKDLGAEKIKLTRVQERKTKKKKSAE
jgi:hypothetical protein